MLIFLVFSTFTTIMFHRCLPELLAGIALPFHEACLSGVPPTEYTNLYGALVCGDRIESFGLKNDLVNLGLIHLMVVSGSHLVFLERFCEPLKKHSRHGAILIFLLLTIFMLAANGQPPILRALVFYMLCKINHRFQFCMSGTQLITTAGFAALPFCGSREAVFSLLLSWLAALALYGAGFLFPRKRLREGHTRMRIVHSLSQNGTVYVLILPALMSLSVPHPISVIVNAVCAFAVGGISFSCVLLGRHHSSEGPASCSAWRRDVDRVYLDGRSPLRMGSKLHSKPA